MLEVNPLHIRDATLTAKGPASLIQRAMSLLEEDCPAAELTMTGKVDAKEANRCLKQKGPMQRSWKPAAPRRARCEYRHGRPTLREMRQAWDQTASPQDRRRCASSGVQRMHSKAPVQLREQGPAVHKDPGSGSPEGRAVTGKRLPHSQPERHPNSLPLTVREGLPAAHRAKVEAERTAAAFAKRLADCPPPKKDERD